MTQFKVDFNDFKRRDNTNLMEITLYKDNGEQITPNRDHQWSGKALKFGDGDKRLGQELAVTLDGDKIGVPSKQLENLPSGDYGLELWEVSNDSKTIYPSAGFIEFHIHQNADESLESVTPTTDLDKIIDDLHQAGLNVVVDDIEMLAPDAKPSVTSEIRDGKNHIKLHIPHGLDNASLTTAPAFQALQTQADQWNRDLTRLQTDVNAIKTTGGGVNLLTSTSDFSSNWSGQSSVSTTTEYNGHPSIVLTSSSQQLANEQVGNLKSSFQYTSSFWAKADNAGDKAHTELWGSIDATDFVLTTNWVRYTAVVTSYSDNQHFVYYLGVPDGNKGNVYIALPMLEEGTVAHPWSPNPSEILTQSDYAKIKAAIVALGGSLK